MNAFKFNYLKIEFKLRKLNKPSSSLSSEKEESECPGRQMAKILRISRQAICLSLWKNSLN